MSASGEVTITYVGPLPEVITRRGIVFEQGVPQTCSKALADALCGPETEFVVGEPAEAEEATPAASEASEETGETETTVDVGEEG